MKEKLHFQEKVTQELQEKMDEVESALAVKRDELTCLKSRREKMRLAARRAQQTACAITDPLLLNHLRVCLERELDFTVCVYVCVIINVISDYQSIAYA